jgi:hypothetical protein
MSKNRKRQLQPNPQPKPVQASIPRASREEHVESFFSGHVLTWVIWAGVISLIIIAILAALPAVRQTAAAKRAALAAAAARPTAASKSAPTNFSTIEVAQAIMVTADLDFGRQIPAVSEAIKEIERRYEPEDGAGRTFAILDAHGETTPDGKLRMSMHVSTEKPGKGAVVFKRTGAVLWEGKIIRSTNKASNFSGKNLLILVDDGQNKGKLLTVDGSNNPATVLDANIKEVGLPLRDLWLDQTEREVTFMYSACGCPVKVQTRREGDRTVRVKDQPVIFPDDPAAVSLIHKIMAW